MWTIAVIFVVFWMVGLVSGYMGLFVHILYAIAIILLLVGIKQEVKTYRELNNTLYSRKRRRLTSGNVGL